jgi:hypothetical protein
MRRTAVTVEAITKLIEKPRPIARVTKAMMFIEDVDQEARAAYDDRIRNS